MNLTSFKHSPIPRNIIESNEDILAGIHKSIQNIKDKRPNAPCVANPIIPTKEMLDAAREIWERIDIPPQEWTKTHLLFVAGILYKYFNK